MLVPLIVSLTIAIPVLLGIVWNRRILRIYISTIPRDLRGLWGLIKVTTQLFYWRKTNASVARVFDSQVAKRRTETCFFFEGEKWTYGRVQQMSYKIANHFQKLGYEKGDVVGLMMGNRPEYVTVWLGLSRIGVVTSLLNYNLRLTGLVHCVSVASCKALIYGTELTQAIQEVVDAGGFKDITLFSMHEGKPCDPILTKEHVNLSKALESANYDPTVYKGEINFNDVILNIYTSGTTGLPKAVVMRQSKVFGYSVSPIMMGLKPGIDVIITPVPLYHVQGGVVGVTAALIHGIPQVMLKKFSASRYWEECIKYGATVSQYLGEIIRYLYNQPEKPTDKLHKIRIFIGNGVNPAIWGKFVERFNNVKICELYGSTEGNCNIINLDGHVGACGYIPLYAMRMAPAFIAEVDELTGEIVRDSKTGWIKRAKVNLPGEVLGIIQDNHPMRQFDGYTDSSATEKKIIRDVRTKGDKWFRTGDMLTQDEYGYLYFKDRSGDTFRWKGENVSTAEVEQVITQASGMKATVIYGVQVPGTEGRAGMAAIADPEGTLDLNNLAQEVIRSLPSYARPLFLRVINNELNMTGTFKLVKVDLQKEGFDIAKVKDTIYFFDKDSFVLLDEKLFQDINSGKIRL